MYDGNFKQITFVIYDSIENSVFESQVRDPLLNMLANHAHCEITLVSFEKETLSQKSIRSLIPIHDRLHFILAHKFPFIGKLSLYPAIEQLKRILAQIPCDSIMARGPLAGLIVLRTLRKRCLTKNFSTCAEDCLCLPRVTIQARGLAAEEYRFAYASEKSIVKRFMRNYLYRELEKIEREVYSTHNAGSHTGHFIIESVSPALKTYLIDHFAADARSITLAANDLPQPVAPEQRAAWRNEVRAELSIPTDAEVYCYAGSAKPWQCGPETVAYFAQIFASNNNALLLLLSKDLQQFEALLAASILPKSSYRLRAVSSDDLLRYLAAADYGMLFRNDDIINWVSRPTKMLEYEAAGLKVIHNDTVGWLVEKD